MGQEFDVGQKFDGWAHECVCACHTGFVFVLLDGVRFDLWIGCQRDGVSLGGLAMRPAHAGMRQRRDRLRM